MSTLQAFTIPLLLMPGTSHAVSNLKAASSSDDPSDGRVDKATFVAAVEILDRELAKIEGLDPPTPLSELESTSVATYAIGKTEATLPISAAGGLGLGEAMYLVLIMGVSPELAEAGFQVKDTIAGITVEGTEFHESTVALSLDATAERLTAAIQMAEKNNIGAIVLQLNRLIELRY
uniref:Lon proteolytic domain-containing protein n=1 Tax=Octactis speculum TaxID=3111310 RepID=A0A7S2HST9_9STRA|eukprot:CAMPEP_0185755666 /NCGR_PEP_ID=MMETSP1174-20130828/14139_1 /TAXON_ID=35687 /ORGANISM="Dictyocha speculum, Strain CCMP1381" /LENGTH=176 /DNA_ID=CAMNT_0028434305 /DNA_START=76 /DNA_END=606 /DNA_ORIENTATION=-